jgi:hypothetical protein
MESCRDDPLSRLLTMPDRPARVDHHLVSTAEFIASSLVEKSDQCILHLFQASSGFFFTALAPDFRRSEGR